LKTIGYGYFYLELPCICHRIFLNWKKIPREITGPYSIM